MGYNNSVRLVTFFSDKRREAVEIIAQRVFNPLYIYLDICFLVFFCCPADRQEKISRAVFCVGGRSFIYARRLRNFPSVASYAQHRGRKPVLGAPLDVHELRNNKFRLDLAVDVEGQAPFRVVAPHLALVDRRAHARLPLSARGLRPSKYNVRRALTTAIWR